MSFRITSPEEFDKKVKTGTRVRFFPANGAVEGAFPGVEAAGQVSKTDGTIVVSWDGGYKSRCTAFWFDWFLPGEHPHIGWFEVDEEEIDEWENELIIGAADG